MSDLLVKLYSLPDIAPFKARLAENGIEVRQGAPSEKFVISDWMRRHFSETWAAESEVALANRPVSCYIAVAHEEDASPSDDPYHLPPEMLVGVACYNASALGMFGPIGVREDYRGLGTGAALLVTCLHAMRAERYAYAVIGWAGPVDFYARTVGATVIEGSEPGIYRGPLRGE